MFKLVLARSMKIKSQEISTLATWLILSIPAVCIPSLAQEAPSTSPNLEQVKPLIQNQIPDQAKPLVDPLLLTPSNTPVAPGNNQLVPSTENPSSNQLNPSSTPNVPGTPSPSVPGTQSLPGTSPSLTPSVPGTQSLPGTSPSLTPSVPGTQSPAPGVQSPLNNQLNAPNTSPGTTQTPQINPSGSQSITPPLTPLQSPGVTPGLPKNVKPSLSATPKETEYTVGPGDVLKVDVFLVPEYGGQYQVLVDGTVTFPLVGNTPVDGMTLAQMSNVLSEKYAKYLKKPIITVGLLSPRPLKVDMYGEINKPGTYTINLQPGQKFPSVTDLIQLSGGLTTAADVREVQITRKLDGKDILTKVNLWELIQHGNIGQDITLRDGDRVFIPTSDIINTEETDTLVDASFGIRQAQTVNVVVVGEVYRPGSYQFGPPNEQSQQSTPTLPKLTGGIKLAGGIKPTADIRKVQLQRETRSGEDKIIEVNLWDLLQKGDEEEDIVLQDGDTIIIPTATAVKPDEADDLATASFSPATIRVNVVGEVKKPGPVDVPSDTPLNQGILAAGGFNDNRAEQGTVQLLRLNPDGTVSQREIEINFAKGFDEQNNPGLRNNDVIVVERNDLTTFTDGLGTVLDPFRNVFPFFGFFR